jgi:acetyl-CoA C-acetyltransferase
MGGRVQAPVIDAGTLTMASSPSFSPVIAGAGRSSAARGTRTPVELALDAVTQAWRDTGLVADKIPIDVLGVLRQAADSLPGSLSASFAQALAKGLPSAPREVIYAEAGGHTSQSLVARMCQRIAGGEISVAVVVGTDADAPSPDAPAGVCDVEDRGPALANIVTRWMGSHGLMSARNVHALIADARRRRIEASAHTVDAIDRLLADSDLSTRVAELPDRAGALILMSTAAAEKLGIPAARLVHLHALAQAEDHGWLQRQRVDDSQAVRRACARVLHAAGLMPQQLHSVQVATPFPVYAWPAHDALGFTNDDPRLFALSASSPHDAPDPHDALQGFLEMVERLRSNPAARALLVAPGHALARCVAGVWSVQPPRPSSVNREPLPERALPSPVTALLQADGHGTLEAVLVLEREPAVAVAVGLLDAAGQRFIALCDERDTQTLSQCAAGASVQVRGFGYGNRFATDAARLAALYLARSRTWRDDYRHCKVVRDGHLLEITIDRAEVRNCLHPEASEELDEIFDAFAADDGLWVAILTGAGTQAFCTGNDLRFAASGRPVYVPRNGFGGLTWRIDLDKPVIAAVNGYAMGGGMELAMACDLIVADTSASFALSEVRVGYLAAGSGLVRLPRRIPPKIATEMVITGRRVPAEEANRLGLVNRLAPTGEALQGARALAAEVLQASPLAVRGSLRVMREASAFADERQAFLHPYPELDENYWSADRAEGTRAFAAKRAPDWKNR